MSRRIKSLGITFIALAVLALPFQNCAKRDFAAKEASEVSHVQPTDFPTTPQNETPVESCHMGQVEVDGACVCPGDSKSDGKSCILCETSESFNPDTKQCEAKCALTEIYDTSLNKCISNCPTGEYWDNGLNRCAPRNADCDLYREIVPVAGAPFVIPARTSEKICYYIKLFDAVANSASKPSRGRRLDVRSRLHGSGGGKAVMANPIIMGTGEVSVYLEGTRDVIMSANFLATQNLKVDNYVLVEIFSGAEKIVNWAAGTADAEYQYSADPNKLAIQVHNAVTDLWDDIPFQVHALGATAEFKSVDFTSQVPLQTAVQIKASALDCGGSEESSDGFLLFK